MSSFKMTAKIKIIFNRAINKLNNLSLQTIKSPTGQKFYVVTGLKNLEKAMLLSFSIPAKYASYKQLNVARPKRKVCLAIILFELVCLCRWLVLFLSDNTKVWNLLGIKKNI